jgi:hypothetical protein
MPVEAAMLRVRILLAGMGVAQAMLFACKLYIGDRQLFCDRALVVNRRIMNLHS